MGRPIETSSSHHSTNINTTPNAGRRVLRTLRLDPVKSLRLRVTIELLGIYFLLEDVTVSTLTYTRAALGENQRTNGLVRAAAAS